MPLPIVTAANACVNRRVGVDVDVIVCFVLALFVMGVGCKEFRPLAGAS